MSHAALNDEVQEHVRRRVREIGPDALGNEEAKELRAEAAELAPDIAALSVRQFRVRYILRARRELEEERSQVEPPAGSGGGADAGELRRQEEATGGRDLDESQRDAFPTHTTTRDQPGLFE